MGLRFLRGDVGAFGELGVAHIIGVARDVPTPSLGWFGGLGGLGVFGAPSDHRSRDVTQIGLGLTGLKSIRSAWGLS